MKPRIQRLWPTGVSLFLSFIILSCPLSKLTYAQPAPDLTVFSQKWPVRANKGEQVPLAFRTKNQGSADAGPFTDHLYVNAKLIKARSLKALKAGQENTKSESITLCQEHRV